MTDHAMNTHDETTTGGGLTDGQAVQIMQAVGRVKRGEESDQALLTIATRIKTDAYAAGFAARGADAAVADGGLRAAVVSILLRWRCDGCFEPDHPCGDPLCAYREELRAALDAAPAPTEDRCRICGGKDGRHDGSIHDARTADLPTVDRADDVVERVRALADEWETTPVPEVTNDYSVLECVAEAVAQALNACGRALRAALDGVGAGEEASS